MHGRILAALAEVVLLVDLSTFGAEAVSYHAEVLPDGAVQKEASLVMRRELSRANECWREDSWTVTSCPRYDQKKCSSYSESDCASSCGTGQICLKLQMSPVSYTCCSETESMASTTPPALASPAVQTRPIAATATSSDARDSHASVTKGKSKEKSDSVDGSQAVDHVADKKPSDKKQSDKKQSDQKQSDQKQSDQTQSDQKQSDKKQLEDELAELEKKKQEAEEQVKKLEENRQRLAKEAEQSRDADEPQAPHQQPKEPQSERGKNEEPKQLPFEGRAFETQIFGQKLDENALAQLAG